MRSRRLTVLALSLTLPAVAPAQTAGTIADSYTRARALLDAAIAAHGGLEALRAARQVARRARCA
jgi:hypothetical protein